LLEIPPSQAVGRFRFGLIMEVFMGYTPGDKAWKSGAIYCREHPDVKAHVEKDKHFPPTHTKDCQWEYS
jgi:hypothetical protein